MVATGPDLSKRKLRKLDMIKSQLHTCVVMLNLV